MDNKGAAQPLPRGANAMRQYCVYTMGRLGDFIAVRSNAPMMQQRYVV
jgi:hypothetical protein